MKRNILSIILILAFFSLLEILWLVAGRAFFAPLFRFESLGDSYGWIPISNLSVYILGVVLRLAIALPLIYLFRMDREKQPLKRFTVFTRKEARQTLWGGAWGAILILAIAAFLFIPGIITFKTAFFASRDIWLTMILMSFVALNEEAIFRGYVLQELSENMSRKAALGISALAFALIHFRSPNFDWLPILNLFLAGLLLGLAYFRFNGIWAPVGLHFGWNFMQGPILGFEVSGQSMAAWLKPEFGDAPAYITGSVYGLEGTVIAVVVQLAAISWLYGELKKQEDNNAKTEAVMEVMPNK